MITGVRNSKGVRCDDRREVNVTTIKRPVSTKEM